MKILYIFQRSLRVEDNNGLRYCEELCHMNDGQIHCIFIFDISQIDKNDYFSPSCFAFMLECLRNLSDSLNRHITFFHGNPEEIIFMLQKEQEYDDIVMCEDYTPYARKRVENITKKLDKSTNFIEIPDVVINTPFTVKPYKKFKPYYVYCHNYNKKFNVDKLTENGNDNYLDKFYDPNSTKYKLSHVKKLKHKNEIDLKDIVKLVEKKLRYDLDMYIKKINSIDACNSSRKHAIGILNNIKKHKKFSDYLLTRDDPNLTTTRLSALMKFGVVSIREVYESIMEGISNAKSKSVKDNLNGLLREIYFRQFYIQTTYHFGKSPNALYNNIKWINDKKQFDAWKTGNTGIPFVDAGMRQMNSEYWMHNRLRMIVASFLIKNLLIDWRWGEKYFAQSLIDYDYSSNLGGWLFSLGSLDGMPYFRVFNPVAQGIKYDKDASYIKKYVPELSDLAPKEIHNWGKSAEYRKMLREKYPKIKNYPDPIIDLEMSHKRAIEVYKKALK